ncbi:MAG: hypothetical protein AAGA21_20105 [Pseudomonadota bacterium]
MRHGKSWAVLAVLLIAGCSSSEPLKDMVGYVPPTSFPAQPKRTLVADRPELVWSQLVNFLEASSFAIDHIDEDKRLLIARYSGDPGPYIDCGSIVTHEAGSLDQIAGSAGVVKLNYKLEEEPVVLNRSLNLDSRIIIRLADQPQGTVIQTDTTYVVTKTVDVEDSTGAIREGSRETVSFEAGGRGEFSKGTACQPNGSLDLAVLQSLPNIVGSDEINRAELQSDGIEASSAAPSSEETVAALPRQLPTNDAPAPEDRTALDLEGVDAAQVPSPEPNQIDSDWVFPEQGLPTAALPAPPEIKPELELQKIEEDAPPTDATQPLSQPVIPQPNATAIGQGNSPSSTLPNAESEPLEEQQSAALDTGEAAAVQSPSTIVDDTTRKLLETLDCDGDEWHFCDLVELTTPLRKRNITELFGLTINTTESFATQVIGRDLKLDILFPSFPSNLHIAYARRDGTIEHVMPSSEVWPADQIHQLTQSNQTIPGPPGLAMIVAIASDKPLFSSPQDGTEDATVYLDRLKQRLDQMEAENPDRPIAASQLLIYVENDAT